ncbi:Aldo/keto reductase [Atractiella rhizophila]|nr:Aldo/keto reductase [Atractiella rhizophila]
MSNKIPVEIIFGGASIGGNVWLNSLPLLDEYLPLYTERGHTVMDTAMAYSPGAETTSESLLGEWKAAEQGWVIDTKANSWFPGGHKRENLRSSLESSLQRLKVDKVRVFYLHKPDKTVPILETLRGVDALYREGKFEKFGVSNHSAADVEEFIKLSEEHGLVRVSVYQGLYNGLARNIETGLLPVLRKHKIAFNAWSVTAGGFFQEKYVLTDPSTTSNTRYGTSTAPAHLTAAYRGMFAKPAMINALKSFHATVKDHGNLSGMEVATRWAVYHSALKGEFGDGVIMGTGKKNHIVEGLEWVHKGPLESWAVEAMETLWKEVQSEAPPFAFDEVPSKS